MPSLPGSETIRDPFSRESLGCRSPDAERTPPVNPDCAVSDRSLTEKAADDDEAIQRLIGEHLRADLDHLVRTKGLTGTTAAPRVV